MDNNLISAGFSDEEIENFQPKGGDLFRKGYDVSTEEDTKTRWGDYGRALGTGTIGIASAIPTLAEYATQGEVGGDTRRYLEGKSAAIEAGMTPVAKRAMNAALLPTEGQESMFDVGVGSSLGLQTTAALPSLIASIIPGGIAGRIAKGASEATRLAIAGGAARGSAGLMNAGDVTQQIFSTLDDMSDDELMKSPAFKGYIDSGLSSADARKKFYTDVAGVTPFLAGGISALLAAPEAELAGRAAGAEIAKKGALKGAISMGLGEAKEEGVESGTGEFMAEQKLAEQNLGDRDWYNVLSKAVQGSAVGFGMGAGSGGVTHMGGVAPDQKLALDQQAGAKPAAETVPEQPETMAMQQSALVSGQRPAMLFPEGTKELDLPEGVDRVETPLGVVHFRPELIDQDKVLELATPERVNELLGYLQSKDQAVQQGAAQGEEPVAAVTRKDGKEVDAAVVSPDVADEQLDILAQRAPAGSTQSIERPGDVVRDRMSAPIAPDALAAMQASAPPKPGVGPAGQAILNQRQAPAPNVPPGWDEDQDAADALAEHEAKWAQPAADRNKPLPPEMEQEYWDALKDHKEQEAWDAYDDYKAEQNTEPTVRYGVDERPEREYEPSLPKKASSSVQTDATSEVTPAAETKVKNDYADTRGAGERFHGTGAPIKKLSDQVALQAGHDKNIYGDGFYTTDAVDMAMGYTKKGGKEPSLYKVKEKPVKLFDMEAPLDRKTRDMVEEALGDYYPLKSSGDEETHYDNLREIFDAFRDESEGNRLPQYEVQEYFHNIKSELEKAGYRGYSHVGGLRTKNAPHAVKIFWHPETDVTVEQVSPDAYKPDAEPAGAIKPKRARRTKDEIDAANAAKAEEKAQRDADRAAKKAAAEATKQEAKAQREAARTEKANRAIEAAQKRAADKAAGPKAPTKTKSKNAVTTTAATEPTTEAAPSGVIRPVYVRVAERLTNKTRVSAEGSHEAKSKQEARKAYAKVAEEAFYAHQPGDDEVYEGAQQIDLLRPKDSMTGSRFVRSDKQRRAIRARIEKFLGAIEGAGHEIPSNVTKNSNNFQLYARVAKDLLTYLDNKSKTAQEAVDNFITDEQAAFSGDFEPMRKRRLEEGDLKSRPNNELNEDTTSGGNGGIGVQAFPAPDEMEDHILDQRVTDMKSAARDIIARQRENTGSIDIGALYLELAAEYPDVIDQFKPRTQAEVEAALRTASAEADTPKAKIGGAIKPKKAEPAPVQKPAVSKEENERLVALMNQLEANKSQPKVYTPTRDIEELGRRLSVGASAGMTQDALNSALRNGNFGSVVSRLIDKGEVVLHPTEATVPGGASQAGPIQAAVTPDGKVHLVAANLDTATANGVLLHEIFHSKGKSLVGEPTWNSLMRQVGSIVSAVEAGQNTNDFWAQAVRRAKAANTSPDMMAEEVAAYAIENAETATPGVRAMVARLLGAVKAWALKRFGVQFGKLTPEQLRSLAIAALRVNPEAVQSGNRYSIAPTDVTDKVSATTQAAKDQGQAAWNKVKRFATRAATLDQMRQMYAGMFVNNKGVDLLNKLVSTVQRMAPMANKLRQQSDELAQRYINLQKSNPEMAQEFSTLALDATGANVRLGPSYASQNDHLKNGGRNAQGKALLSQLQQRYNALSPEAKQLYQDMAAYYREMQNRMVRSLVNNRLKSYGVNPKDRDGFINKIISGEKLTGSEEALFKDKEYDLDRLKQVSQLRVIQGDYFPMMRYGKFVVNTNNKIEDLMGGTEIEPGKVEFRAKTDKAARELAEKFAGEVGLPQTNWQKSPVSQANDYGYIVSVQTRGAHFFESEAEAIAWRRENAGDFDEISDVAPIRETGLQGGDLTTAQLNSLQATIRNSNYSDEEKEAALEMLKQGSAVLMSGNRIQKRGVARRKVMGASKDFGRNALQYGEAVSSRIAQLEFRPEIDEALEGMREINKDLMDKQQPDRTAVINELTARIDSNVTNVKQPPRWLTDIMSVTFLSRLASPMYSVVNAMQPWMVTYPVLAGRYGPARAASMMTEAYGAIGFTEQAFAGLKNTYLAGKNFNSAAILNTTDVAKSIREKLKSQPDGAELSKVIDMLVERGGMSEGGFEMAQAISQGRGTFGTTLAKVDRIARQAPAAVEDINRAISAIAAYRLARKGMSEENARQHAFNVVMNTQGDYSGVNAPRFFNETWLRPAFQFKKYAQMMTYVLADMTHRAFGPNSPIEERKIALGQLGSLVAVQIAMAGTLSLPGIELAKMGFMVAAALGFGGGWDDEEEKLRKIADETFGADWGQLVTRGVLTRALNMDFSQKFSLADMYTFGEPKSYKREDWQSYLWQMVAGAPGGTVEDMRTAVLGAVQGDWSTNEAAIGTMAKAAEKFIPVKVISDAFKAANRYSEGKASGYEAALNLLGIQSANQAEKNRKTGNDIRASQALEATHKQLTDQYLKAKTVGERMKIRARIIEFNKTAPLRKKVFPNGLDEVRKRQEEERVN